jgi:hypothetical protein
MFDELQNFNPKDRKSTTDVLRHEFGHLVAARDQGFTTGEVELKPTTGAAVINIIPSLKDLQDVQQFLAKRIRVLYAGVLAQSLVRSKINTVVANTFLDTTAPNDYAKLRELVRTLAGIEHHDATDYDDFEAKMKGTNDRLYGDAIKIVETNAELIVDLAIFAMSKIDSAMKAGRFVDSFIITKDEIDGKIAELSKKP